MRKLDLVSSLFFLCLAVAVAAGAVGLKIGTFGKPGPGFFPFGGALLVGASSAALLLQSVRRKDGGRAAEAEPARWWSVACVLGAVVAFALLLNVLGFALCTFLMFVFFLRVVTAQGWSKTLVVAACVSVGAFVLFELLLKAQLPRGFLGFM